MLTERIQSCTNLVVDWSDQFSVEPASFMIEYNTSVVPFKRWDNLNGTWKSTEYTSIEQMQQNGADIVWMPKESK